MFAMRLALAQINPTVGDVAGNLQKHIDAVRIAASDDVSLIIFPEMSLVGYPPKDLLLKPALIEQCTQAMQELVSCCRGIGAIFGMPMINEGDGRPLRNAAVLARDGRVIDRRFKSLLPTYDVFDEHRYFEPGKQVDVTDAGGIRLGISVCEDLWNAAEHFERRIYHDNPIDQLAAAGAKLFINCSASPYIMGKHNTRLELMCDLAKQHGLPIVFVNQVGANDELIFDGNSCVVAADGSVIAHAKGFEEDLVIVDLSPAASASERSGPEQPSDIATVYEALVLGVRDYCRKCGFGDVVIGLSGGIDSAVTAAIAVAALGADHVTGITMPSRYSSGGSVEDSRLLAERTGITFHSVPIETAHAAMEQTLEPHFKDTTPGIAEENVQARLRGLILMSFSNKFGKLLLTTGNKSEMAVGYCTLYGDMAGGLAVLSDVPKTLVYELAEYMNTPGCALYQQCGGPPIPEDTITKPPSAELRPDQKDTDSLPEYAVLDEIIDRYVEREQSAKVIIEQTGFDAEMVMRFVKLIDRNEYKRKQTPPGLKVTGRAFGFGRRMPIAQRYDPT
jgi:NAD+ synthase (glutamine-hydrolysing)